MRKRLVALYLVVALMCLFVLPGCADNAPAPVKQVGTSPDPFSKIIENNLFDDIAAFDECLLKVEDVSIDKENRTNTRKVRMLDLYGNELAEYTCTSDDAYSITTLTATADGGFLFVLGFSDYYSSEQNAWASEKGYASRVIKCNKNGKLQFDTPLESVTGRALRHCFERNGCFYFFGTIETPETNKTGVISPTDIYMVKMDKSGAVLKTQCIAGTDYDDLEAAEIFGEGFKLSIRSQSDDGAFAGSDSKGYPKDWVVTVDSDLAITEKKKETGRDSFDVKLGEKDGEPVYKTSAYCKDFDAGTPTAFIDYGDFYMLVSSNITGEYEKTPPMISAIWHYTETVYSAYDYEGKLLFRKSVDSSPDFDAWAEDYYG